MAKTVQNDVEATELVEKAIGNVFLQRRTGSFVNKEGESVEYVSYALNINGAVVSVDLDKDVKSLIGTFVQFEKV